MPQLICLILSLLFTLSAFADNSEHLTRLYKLEQIAASTNPEFESRVQDSLLSLFPAQKQDVAWFRLAQAVKQASLLASFDESEALIAQAKNYFEASQNVEGLAACNSLQAYYAAKQSNYAACLQHLIQAKKYEQLSKSESLEHFLTHYFNQVFYVLEMNEALVCKPILLNPIVEQLNKAYCLARAENWSNLEALAAGSLIQEVKSINELKLQLLYVQALIHQNKLDRAKGRLLALTEQNTNGNRVFQAEIELHYALLNARSKDYLKAIEYLQSSKSLYNSVRKSYIAEALDGRIQEYWLSSLNSGEQVESPPIELNQKDAEKHAWRRLFLDQLDHALSKKSSTQTNKSELVIIAEKDATIKKLYRLILLSLGLFFLLLLIQFSLQNRSKQKLKRRINNLEKILADKEQSIQHSMRVLGTKVYSSLAKINEDKLEQDQAYLQEVKAILKPAMLYERINGEQAQIQKTPTEIYKLIKQVLTENLSKAQQKEQELFLSTSISPWSNIELDQQLFQELINELCTNAIKFSFPGTRIDFELSSANKGSDEKAIRGVQLVMINQAEAIAQADQSAIFNAFYALNNRSESSNGLGLSFVKKVLQLHGGEISVENLGPKTVCFNIWIPCMYEVIPVDKEVIKIGPEEELINNIPDGPYFGILNLSDIDILDVKKLYPAYSAVRVSGLDDINQLFEAANKPLCLCLHLEDDANGIELLKSIRAEERFKLCPLLIFSPLAKIEGLLAEMNAAIDELIKLNQPKEAQLSSLQFALALREYAFSEREKLTEPELLSLKKHNLAEVSYALLESKNFLKTLKVQDFARANHLKTAQFSRLLKASYGLSPGPFIKELRLKEAKRSYQLSENISLENLAEKCGFENQKVFKNAFQTRFGIDLD